MLFRCLPRPTNLRALLRFRFRLGYSLRRSRFRFGSLLRLSFGPHFGLWCRHASSRPLFSLIKDLFQPEGFPCALLLRYVSHPFRRSVSFDTSFLNKCIVMSSAIISHL